jgi:predicted phage tail protein
LVCAVLASLASGVLLAYGICLAMFGVFRMHAAQVTTQSKTPIAEHAQIAEG